VLFSDAFAGPQGRAIDDQAEVYLGTDHDFLSATASFILLISAFRRTSRIAFPIAARIFCSCVELIRATFRRVLVVFTVKRVRARIDSCADVIASRLGAEARDRLGDGDNRDSVEGFQCKQIIVARDASCCRVALRLALAAHRVDLGLNLFHR